MLLSALHSRQRVPWLPISRSSTWSATPSLEVAQSQGENHALVLWRPRRARALSVYLLGIEATPPGRQTDISDKRARACGHTPLELFYSVWRCHHRETGEEYGAWPPFSLRSSCPMPPCSSLFSPIVCNAWHHSALKVIPRASIVSAQQVAHVMSEKSVLKRSSIAACPFIVGLVSTDKDDENLYFVLELLTGGSLADHMRHIDLSSGYDWTLAVRFYLAEVLLALKAIHEEGCIYRDLKANNVVLSADGHAKLVDFGFAKVSVVATGQLGRRLSRCQLADQWDP